METAKNEPIKYGMVEWGDEVPRKNKYKNDSSTSEFDRSIFLKYQNGDNEMRILSPKPFRHMVHKFKVPGMTGFGLDLDCAGEDENGVNVCPLCALAAAEKDEDKQKAMSAKDKYYVPVICRRENRVKIAEFTSGLKNAVKKYKDDKRYGDPQLYDITIKVDKSALQKGSAKKDYYTVMPIPPIPASLSEDDLKLKKEFDFKMLERLTTPPKPERVLKRMEAIRAKFGSNGSTQTASEPDAKPSKDGDVPDFPQA